MISRFHLLLVSLRTTACLSIATLVVLHTSGFAQEIPKSAFALLNIVPKDLLIKICLETNQITSGKEALAPGFYSGLMPWNPPKAILTAEAPGYQTAELKPFLKITETPLIVLQEIPGKILQFTILANSKERAPSFYDAINLTSQENLQAEKKDVTLPRNQRVRLSKAKAFSYAIPGRELETLDPSDGGNYLLVFYSRTDGTVECYVTFDNPL
ncbi:MAG: hypothetical protein NTY56_00515 [Patescibacteria group bacterium]|nr:hypothetical protein [Patescibacteria group bacterium]